MSSANVKKRRKSILIYPKFQLAIIGLNVFITMIAASFVIHQIYGSFDGVRDNIKRAGFLPDHPYFLALDSHLQGTVLRVGIVFLLAIIFAAMASLYVSQRLVGPIYRLQNILKESIATKKNIPISFRDGDYFDELPALINQVIASQEKNKQE